MGRGVTNLGNIFLARNNEEKKKYSQLIEFDPTKLNSDVIWAFKKFTLLKGKKYTPNDPDCE